jgi:hypothetical protein
VFVGSRVLVDALIDFLAFIDKDRRTFARE